MENSASLPNIRIRKITLTDFRNIVHAEVDIPGGKMTEYINGEPSILGLYGQNGSGKTSLLMAISALKCALSGSELLFSDFASCIRSGCSQSRLEFEFSAFNEKGTLFDLYYAFSIAIESSEKDNESSLSDFFKEKTLNAALDMMGYPQIMSEKGIDTISQILRPKNKKIVVFDELLQFASMSHDGKKSNKQVLIDTSEVARKSAGKAFGNKKKYEQLTSKCESDIDEHLSLARIEAQIRSTSFIFSRKVVKTLVDGSDVEDYKLILRALYNFGNNYLFVILMELTAANNMKMLPFSLWMNDPEDGAFGLVYPVQLYDHCTVPEEMYSFIVGAIKSVGDVISKIVPNLSIGVEDVGKTVTANGNEIHIFDLVSIRGDVRIPLVYESDGIRRIISFLSFAIAVYNNPSVTVAIDEMDSGIFEYMLGELLSIMKESAKGQLIFTSHNLRPLEVLPCKNLLFTTVNPQNRFAKLEGISGNNNLRDSYYRTIVLGTGKDAFYDSTDSFNIEQAFFEAGLSLEEHE